MPPHSDTSHKGSTDKWDLLEAVIGRFEDSWQKGQRPAIADYLPAEAGERQAVLVELVHTDLEYRLKAGELIKPVAELVGGKGGGRPDFAQAGGTKPDQVDAALALVPGLISAA